MSILVIGSTCVDLRLHVDALPQRAGDQAVRKRTIQLGGCAYNVASVIEDCTLFSPIGTGLFGNFVKEHLFSAPFGLISPTVEEENGICVCLIEPDGQRTFLSAHGAEYHFRPEWFDKLEADWIYICGIDLEEKQNACLVDVLEDSSAQIFFAPGPRVAHLDPTLVKRLLALRPVLHMNREEAEAMTGRPSDEAMKDLWEKTGRPVIVTDGDKGAYAYEGCLIKEPSIPIKSKDVTGAGDTHAGICLKLLVEDRDLRPIIKAANAAAAEAIR